MQIDKIRIIAIYLIGIGLLMTITWILLFLTHQVTDIETKPLEMLFLLLGEAITILLLIFGGSGLLLRHKGSFNLTFLALGTLTYSMFYNLGYSAQHGDIVMVFLMLLMIVVNFGVIVYLLIHSSQIYQGYLTKVKIPRHSSR